MPDETALTIYQRNELAGPDLAAQVRRIEEAMRLVMRPGEHYGVIPGCGSKPVLFQPGAQKLALLFGFSPTYTVNTEPAGNGHVSYSIVCRLVQRSTGMVIGEGMGICSTLESKYRYRVERLGAPPREWLTTRDPGLLPPGCEVRKDRYGHVVIRRTENENPADYYHTCQAIAKKRAFVDAVRTNTACADMFSGSPIVDAGEVIDAAGDEPPLRPPTAVSQETPAAPESPKAITPAQRKLMFARAGERGVTDAALKAQIAVLYNVASSKDVPAARFDEILHWIDAEPLPSSSPAEPIDLEPGPGF